MACFDSGMMSATPLFMFSAGIHHWLASKSISDHSAFLNSPGRANTSGANLRAHRVVSCPVYPSIARSSSPIFAGSVIEAY